ncbi:TPA: hypothetical protein ACU9T0_006112 [Burkholderia cenocepacia]|uniref:hypothetical protein n=1 Tax=Burkholderia cenocepacia TaxID=95486 RepID=UPI002AB6D18D|nr:hypothetical protein [Burkholderia cenocepacia]
MRGSRRFDAARVDWPRGGLIGVRDTIEHGDVVELQARGGPRLRATVSYAESRDDSYHALVTEFVGADDVGDELDGDCLGERAQFARVNVIYLEQRVPVTGARKTGRRVNS